MAPVDVLRGERVVLRRATLDDAEALSSLISSPGIVEWWTSYTPEQARDDLGATDDAFVVYCVLLDDELVGLVQYGQELDPQYLHADIDVSIAPSHHRQGFATDALRTLARHLVDDLGHHRITIDPAAHNQAAIACYTKLGFRPVGVLRQYERGIDGTFHDGLLMEMLADELVR